MSEKRQIQKDDLMSVMLLVIMFISVIGGREIGNFYSSFSGVSNLKALFEVEEEELSRYLRDTLEGVETDLEIGYSITSPAVDTSEDMVTVTPDYIKRWIIGLTVSPVTVNQPEASTVELVMIVEDQTVDNDIYDFPKQKISYLGLRDRNIDIEIDDTETLRRVLMEASEEYGGEVRVEFKGRVQVHLLFLDTWLPFHSTRHTLIRFPYLTYIDSNWRNLEGEPVSTVSTGSSGYVLLEVRNPTRIHSLHEPLTCEFYQEGVGEVSSVVKEVSMPPASNGQYIFQFSFTEPGVYTYRIRSGDNILVEETETQILTVE